MEDWVLSIIKVVRISRSKITPNKGTYVKERTDTQRLSTVTRLHVGESFIFRVLVSG